LDAAVEAPPPLNQTATGSPRRRNRPGPPRGALNSK